VRLDRQVVQVAQTELNRKRGMALCGPSASFRMEKEELGGAALCAAFPLVQAHPVVHK